LPRVERQETTSGIQRHSLRIRERKRDRQTDPERERKNPTLQIPRA